jgi:RHS repeat-associated protein
MDGDDIAVYRAQAGGEPERVLHGRATTVFAGPIVALIANDGCYASVDDFSFDTVESGQYVARYNDANEMIWSADNTGRTAYTYDAWGRTLTKSRAVDASTTHTAGYLYRFGDKLKNYSTNFPGETPVQFNYDGLGKRRNKLVEGTEITWYRWAGWSIVSEYDGGTVQTDWDPGAVEKSYVPGLGEYTSTSNYAHYLQDHLGSTRNVLDGAKSLLARLEYTPYGEELQFGGNLPSPRYTGHHWDAETGMYFAPFRYYMPGSGRWLGRDPLGFVDGPNVYGYVNNNPLIYVDPDGRFSWALPVLSGFIGGALGAIDQSGCGWKSMALGALYGGGTGFAKGAAAALGPLYGFFGGAAASFGGTWFKSKGDLSRSVSAAVGGAMTGLLAGGLAARPGFDDNPVLKTLAGFTLGLWTNVSPKFPEVVKGPPRDRCL